jgi:hypothetical protein
MPDSCIRLLSSVLSSGGCCAFGVAVDSGVLDKDQIKLDITLFSSNQIV